MVHISSDTHFEYEDFLKCACDRDLIDLYVYQGDSQLAALDAMLADAFKIEDITLKN